MAGQSCPLCSKPIDPGENVAFQHVVGADGRVAHKVCPREATDERRLVRFSPSDRRAFAEASLTVREVWHRARAVHALARQVRAR